jgi:hypothetical protein
MPKTANLQGLSVAVAARLMNVSERSVYMAQQLTMTGRADLVEQVETDKLSLLGALKQAVPHVYSRPPDRVRALAKAWEVCSAEERKSFLELLTPIESTGLTHNQRPKGLCDVS